MRMDAIAQVCPRFHRAVELIGKRWTGAIVRSLMDGPRRFSDLMQAIPGLHDPLLSERLKELECEGIVVRRVYDETPVRIEYALTPKGRSLERVVAEIERWAARWVPRQGRTRRARRKARVGATG